MEQTTIINLLTNSGLKVFGMDSDFIYFEDPSCIFPAFDSVLEYAWFAILLMLAIMFFGWGVLYIKNGIKINTVFNNAKTLILVLGTLAMVKPAVNIVYGDNLFAKQCEIKQVSISSVKELLDMRNKKFGKSDEYLLYETFNMIDSGPLYQNADALQDFEIETINKQSQSSGFRVSDITAIEYENNTTIYIAQNGEKIKRIGGTVAWRNNNPGNIRKSKFAYANGAVGETDKWAVFPDEETGLRAITKLLRTNNYNNLSVKDAIHRWAPFSDGNNPENYSRHVAKITGLSPDARIKDLSDNDLMQIARAIQTIEGWGIGHEQRI